MFSTNCLDYQIHEKELICIFYLDFIRVFFSLFCFYSAFTPLNLDSIIHVSQKCSHVTVSTNELQSLQLLSAFKIAKAVCEVWLGFIILPPEIPSMGRRKCSLLSGGAIEGHFSIYS